MEGRERPPHHDSDSGLVLPCSTLVDRFGLFGDAVGSTVSFVKMSKNCKSGYHGGRHRRTNAESTQAPPRASHSIAR